MPRIFPREPLDGIAGRHTAQELQQRGLDAAAERAVAADEHVSTRKMRVLYVSGPAERATLLQSLRAAGATVVDDATR